MLTELEELDELLGLISSLNDYDKQQLAVFITGLEAGRKASQQGDFEERDAGWRKK